MTVDQKRARVFGVLYLITFVTSIPALALYETVLRHPVGYVAGAVETNSSLEDNRTAFREFGYVPRVLVDVSKRSQQTTLFGKTCRTASEF